MSRSHNSPPKPSTLLALICLALVRRLHPEWTRVTLGQALSAQRGISAERLSRLATRVIAHFETSVATLTRIGRPRRDAVADAVNEDHALISALLDIATSILSRVRLRRAVVQPLVVGAWVRLRTKLPALTQKRFCEALALSPRTLRSWLVRSADDATAPVTQPPPTQPRRPRPARRPRFGFNVTLPDTQLAADTTDLKAFCVPLKLVAAQDVGGRDSALLDAVIVDDNECSEHVVAIITAAVNGRPGMQAITDQGTPYMAEATREALEALETEHAPQREADPLGKATIERAFGSVKSLARPLLAVTNQLAAVVPALKNVTLAKSITTVLLAALLRAYQAGARAAHRAAEARGGIDVDQLAQAAAENRDLARADDRSVRLLLTRIHHSYGIDRPLLGFIRSLRIFPLPVLQQAERAFARQAHRDDIRCRASYFSGIVRRLHSDYQRDQAQRQRERAAVERIHHNDRCHTARQAAWNHDPASWLRDALDALAAQYHGPSARLLFAGAGVGLVWMRAALARLLELHDGTAAIDIAASVFRDFRRDWIDRIGNVGVDAVAQKLRHHLAALPTQPATVDRAPRFAAAILSSTGPPQRPDPPFPLRT